MLKSVQKYVQMYFLSLILILYIYQKGSKAYNKILEKDVVFLLSSFPRQKKIVFVEHFLRDNFNCSPGLTQWCGLDQILR